MMLFIFYIIIGFVFWVSSSVYVVIIAKEHNQTNVSNLIMPSDVLVTFMALFLLQFFWLIIFLWSIGIYGIGKIIGKNSDTNFKNLILGFMLKCY